MRLSFPSAFLAISVFPSPTVTCLVNFHNTKHLTSQMTADTFKTTDQQQDESMDRHTHQRLQTKGELKRLEYRCAKYIPYRYISPSKTSMLTQSLPLLLQCFQLSTVGVTPYCTSTSALHRLRMKGLCVWLFLITMSHGQPHTVFWGFISILEGGCCYASSLSWLKIVRQTTHNSQHTTF